MFRVSGVMVLEERGCLCDRPDQPVWRCLSSSRVAVYLRPAGTSYCRVGCGVLSGHPTVVSSELSCRLWSSVGSSFRRPVGAVVSSGVRGGCRYVISLELSSEVMGVVSAVVSSSESCLSFLLSCLRLRRLLQPAAAGVLHRVVVECLRP